MTEAWPAARPTDRLPRHSAKPNRWSYISILQPAPLAGIKPDINLRERKAFGQLTADTRSAVEQAGVVLVPDDGFREYGGPVFPQGTVDFLHFLRDHAPGGITVEIAAEDTNYKEVALHFDIIRLATLFVEYVAAPTAVALIAEYLKHRLGNGRKSTEVRTALMVHQKDGQREHTVRIAYEGPAVNVEGALRDAVASLANAGQPAEIAATSGPTKALPDTRKQQSLPVRKEKRKNRR